MPKAFAGFVRVSTEAQERQGESLNIQRKAIDAAAAALGGSIASDAWYGGQEHATAGHEKKEFHRLLGDVAEGRFVGVIVSDIQRFTRDPDELGYARKVFLDCDVGFYLGTRKVNLLHPDDNFEIEIQTVINKNYVEKLKFKSRESRIERARKGQASAGTKPYGREFAAETGKWRALPEAKRLMEKVAELYLDGGLTYEQIGLKVGLDANTLRRRVEKAGDVWHQTFRHNGREERVPTPVEELLPADVREAMKRQAEANRLHTGRQNEYPLRGLPKCAICGSVFSGHAPKNRDGTFLRYYWHSASRRSSKECPTGIRADALEAEVFYQIWGLMRSSSDLRKAIQDAVGATESFHGEMLKEKADLEGQFDKLDRQQGNAARSLLQLGEAAAGRVNALIEDSEAKKNAIRARLGEIDAKLIQVKIPDDLKERTERIVASLLKGGGPMNWKPAEQQQAARLFLGLPTHHARQGDSERGIFLRQQMDDSGEKYWSYELRGELVVAGGTVGPASVGSDDRHREPAKLTGRDKGGARLPEGLVSLVQSAPYVERRGHRRSSG